jgi:hypothetical protein
MARLLGGSSKVAPEPGAFSPSTTNSIFVTPAPPQPPKPLPGIARQPSSPQEQEDAGPALIASPPAPMVAVPSLDQPSSASTAELPSGGSSSSSSTPAAEEGAGASAATAAAEAATITTNGIAVPKPAPVLVASHHDGPATDRLRVLVGTWNLHGSEPEQSLAPWLGTPSDSGGSSSSSSSSSSGGDGGGSSGGGGSSSSDGGANRPPADVIAIGTQEAFRSIEASVLIPSKGKWLARLQAAVGKGYVCVGSQALCAIHVAVFVRLPLLPLVSHVQSAHVATGIGNGTLGNKGGVAIGLAIGRTSFLFVNAHFAAHQHKTEQRNADWQRIDSSLPLRPPQRNGSPKDVAMVLPSPRPAGEVVENGGGEGGSTTARFDRAFWFGDLNYRINGNREMVDALLSPADERARASESWEGEAAHWEHMRAVLLNNDQLRCEMRAGRVFSGGWREGEISFRPTYKFDRRQPDLYDQSEKRRIPAYTDRVLWRTSGQAAEGGGASPGQPVPLPRGADAAGHGASASAGAGAGVNGATPSPEVELLRYDACPSLTCSDHKPVAAEFSVRYEAAREAPAVAKRASHHGSARFGASSSAVRNPSPRDLHAHNRAAGSAAQSAICSVM